MRILKNKNYPGIMYASLLIISLLILFSLVSILEKSEIKSPQKKITAYAVFEEQNYLNETLKKSDSYGLGSYLIYYGLMAFLIMGVSTLLIRFIYKIKI